ncbi:hypothetical protein [Kitasatospora herbaricolor]|uniref:Uncharacterized protein n=1 Tax=Kitasatospora herbaricolor TaxID=68217 RepID=A0ABZ1WJI1_9ACTN|nr:hypothetical protein [Kitasatospora herbaricolor]
MAQILSSGKIFGIGIGAQLHDFEQAIGFDHVDDVQGRQGRRLMRRDYGLLEVTFDGEPGWKCRWISVEVHRFSRSIGLIEEVRELTGVDFSQYTPWADVQREFERLVPCVSIQPPIIQGGHQEFHLRDLGVTVQVVHDRKYMRGDFPGFGDIWSIGLSLPVGK